MRIEPLRRLLEQMHKDEKNENRAH
jgi:hypothetical protein